MTEARETLSPWITVLGSAVAFSGVLAAETWLTLFGIGCSAISATAALSLAPCKSRPLTTGVNIEGLNLDSLHIANLRRRLNRSLRVQRGLHVAIINGPDLTLAWQHDGICLSERETAIEFSVDSENNVPFNDLDCFAFDLQNDPARLRQIRPTLIGNDGLSKKISVPFLEPLKSQQRFSVLLNCNLPGCVTSGVQYYTSSFSFDQPSVDSATVHMIFVKCRPHWVRAYEYRQNGEVNFVGDIRPFRDDGVTCEYLDSVQNVPGQSVRVYLYDLPAVELQTGNRALTQSGTS
jgi:hypothetical protein